MINKINNILTLTLLLLGFSLITNAQDKKAKSLLDEVTAKIKSYDNVVIDFKYVLNNSKENINQISKGNVTLQGNKYILNFMGVTKIFDGKKTYTIVPEDEEVTVSNINGRKIQYIKLTPNSNKDQRKEILLGIDIQTKTINNLIEIGKNGTKTTLTVNSFKSNQPLSKNQFTFVASKYPNYYINKLD